MKNMHPVKTSRITVLRAFDTALWNRSIKASGHYRLPANSNTSTNMLSI